VPLRLVGSEMCIRDSGSGWQSGGRLAQKRHWQFEFA
jgi:hypothetical protein